MKAIIARDIHKSFAQPGGKKLDVLTGANLEISVGEIVAIVGPSGSGKSTLLNILGLMDLSDSGSLSIFSQSTEKISETSKDLIRQKEIGFLFQFDSLIEELNLMENLDLVAMIKNNNNDSSQKAQEICRQLGIESLLNRYPREFSSGELTRANLAKALVGAPRILLADEPTGNLDPKNARQIAGDFVSMARKKLSAVLVTHNLDIAKMADRVLELKNGILEEK
ncbi:ABC transporter ATP-binding protein [Elusimicrobiota bacterium]